MAWVDYLFNGLGDKASQLTHLAPRTDVEINEKIRALTFSYTIEIAEDTFRLGTIFESFHHQAKILISNRALLPKFLMLWLKWCIVLTLSHKVIVADVVYPAVQLVFCQSIALLPTMMGCV